MISLIETLTTIQIPNELSISAGRKYANEQLMLNVPEKATRDFILMNLFKNDDGRLVFFYFYCSLFVLNNLNYIFQ